MATATTPGAQERILEWCGEMRALLPGFDAMRQSNYRETMRQHYREYYRQRYAARKAAGKEA